MIRYHYEPECEQRIGLDRLSDSEFQALKLVLNAGAFVLLTGRRFTKTVSWHVNFITQELIIRWI